MSSELTPPWLIVPGWGGSGPEHWQTLWTNATSEERVALADWEDPRRSHWLAAIDLSLAQLARRDPRPPIVIAHSLGCIAIAHWARTTRRAIRAALLVAPADVDRAACAPLFREFQPLPLAPLPFRSLVVTADDDPYITVPRAEQTAVAWGSELHVIRGAGHLNTASRLGTWPEGQALLAGLVRQTSLVDEATLGRIARRSTPRAAGQR